MHEAVLILVTVDCGYSFFVLLLLSLKVMHIKITAEKCIPNNCVKSDAFSSDNKSNVKKYY
jgi:hypothetical protein